MTIRHQLLLILAATFCCGLNAAGGVEMDLGAGSILRYVTPAPSLDDEESLPLPEFDRSGVATVRGLRLERRVERIDGGFAIRVVVTNTRQQNIRLRRVVVLDVDRPENLLVGSKGIANWSVFRLARHKNDVPGPFRPVFDDAASREAAADHSQWQRRKPDPAAASLARSAPPAPLGRNIKYHADPALVVSAEGAPPESDVFLGFDGQTEHLNDVMIEVDRERTELVRLTATAEFDGAVLVPGASRETHRFIVQSRLGREGLLREHVARIKKQYGSRHASHRNVFCTWYFYGPEIDEKSIQKDLVEIRRRPLVLDTYLIDYNWDDRFGDWNADAQRFPGGMASTAKRIASAGLLPGIWSAPFLIDRDAAVLLRYPDLILKNRAGEAITFEMDRTTRFVLDPTAPSAEAYLVELCGRMRGWGFGYLKFDFLRVVLLDTDVAFHDKTKTRAQAYRRGLELLRKGSGDEVMIGTWGGLYEANAGLVDINRCGSDVRGHWDPHAIGDYAPITRYPVRIRQTVARALYAPLWTSDQDALMVRRRELPWREDKPYLSIGVFTDDEAFSTAVYRFIGGGVVMVSEKLDELDADRFQLYKTVVPTYAPVAIPIGKWDQYLPELFVSHFDRHANLPAWAVVSMCNWNGGSAKTISFRPSDVPGLPVAESYAAFEYRTQRFLGVFGRTEEIAQRMEKHSARVVRLTPLRGDGTYLVGSDLNLSSGMEFESVQGKAARLRPEVREFEVNCTFMEWRGGKGHIETRAAVK